MTQPVIITLVALLGLVSIPPAAASGEPQWRPCEDLFSEEWCETLAPPSCEEFLGPRCAGPAAACRSVLADGICAIAFAE